MLKTTGKKKKKTSCNLFARSRQDELSMAVDFQTEACLASS